MWKLLLQQILRWIKQDAAGEATLPEPAVPPELAAQAMREEIAILSEQRLRLWRATAAYREFDCRELADGSLCLVKAVEERIDLLEGPSTPS